jgi:ferrous iron transport protein A
MTINDLKPGQSGIITVIGGEGALRRHLLDMGLTPNTKVTVRKVAPMGDPIELFLRSYVLTIRRDDAAKIEIDEVNS